MYHKKIWHAIELLIHALISGKKAPGIFWPVPGKGFEMQVLPGADFTNMDNFNPSMDK